MSIYPQLSRSPFLIYPYSHRIVSFHTFPIILVVRKVFFKLFILCFYVWYIFIQ